MARLFFRPREKSLILLVLATFGFVCFGAIFFLPDKSSIEGGNKVKRVYAELGAAGREFMLPPPPSNQLANPNARLGDEDLPDHHALEDRARLMARVELDAAVDKRRRKHMEDQQKEVLPKPNLNPPDVKPPKQSSSSSPKPFTARRKKNGQKGQEREPLVEGGEDADGEARERRNKVAEVSFADFYQRSMVSFFAFYVLSVYFVFNVAHSPYLLPRETHLLHSVDSVSLLSPPWPGGGRSLSSLWSGWRSSRPSFTILLAIPAPLSPPFEPSAIFPCRPTREGPRTRRPTSGGNTSKVYVRVPRSETLLPQYPTSYSPPFLQMMKHAWDGYETYAWGKNEVKPISKRGHSASIFGSASMGATIVDGLDTLYIMGFMEEYKRGRQWVADHLDITQMVR